MIKRYFHKILYLGFVLCTAMGWWGVLYPQLTLTGDTYAIVMEDGTVQKASDVVEWDLDDSVYMDILNTDLGRIRFRSRLLKEFSGYVEHLGGK